MDYRVGCFESELHACMSSTDERNQAFVSLTREDNFSCTIEDTAQFFSTRLMSML